MDGGISGIGSLLKIPLIHFHLTTAPAAAAAAACCSSCSSCCCWGAVLINSTSRGATGFFGFFYRTALARFPGRCDVFGHAWVQRGWGRLHIGPLGQNPARKRGQASASPGFRTCLATTTTGTRGHGGRGANRNEESRGARWGEATRRKPTGTACGSAARVGRTITQSRCLQGQRFMIMKPGLHSHTD